MLNNLPVDVMVADEPGPVVAVDVMRRLDAAGVDVGQGPLLPTIVETLSRATVLGSVERAEANRALAHVLIAPDVHDVSLRGFRNLDRAVDAGRRAAEQALADGAQGGDRGGASTGRAAHPRSRRGGVLDRTAVGQEDEERQERARSGRLETTMCSSGAWAPSPAGAEAVEGRRVEARDVRVRRATDRDALESETELDADGASRLHSAQFRGVGSRGRRPNPPVISSSTFSPTGRSARISASTRRRRPSSGP